MALDGTTPKFGIVSVPVMFESLGRENPKLISIMPSSSFQGGTVSNSTSNSTYLYFIMEPTLLGSSPPNSQYFSGSASVSDLHGLRLGSTLGIHDVSVPAVKVLGRTSDVVPHFVPSVIEVSAYGSFLTHDLLVQAIPMRQTILQNCARDR